MSRMSQTDEQSEQTNRRAMLEKFGRRGRAGNDGPFQQQPARKDQPPAEHIVKNGRIKQSIVYWCFEKHWTMEQAAKVAKDLGCLSIELVAPSSSHTQAEWAHRAIGTIDMGADAPFVKGFNNPKYREQVVKATTDAIDACVTSGARTSSRSPACAKAFPTTKARQLRRGIQAGRGTSRKERRDALPRDAQLAA